MADNRVDGKRLAVVSNNVRFYEKLIPNNKMNIHVLILSCILVFMTLFSSSYLTASLLSLSFLIIFLRPPYLAYLAYIY